MTALALALGFVGVFALGIGTGFAIAHTMYARRTRMQRAVDAARLQGRLDRLNERTGLQPPEPWQD